jgi:hypothetical protein
MAKPRDESSEGSAAAGRWRRSSSSAARWCAWSAKSVGPFSTAVLPALRAGRRSAQLVDAAGGALFILKHMHDLSDEVLCARWLENPLYLTYRAEKAGYHPQLILAGRQVKTIGARVARQCVRMMLRQDGARGPVTILGLSFKENVPDIRNSARHRPRAGGLRHRGSGTRPDGAARRGRAQIRVAAAAARGSGACGGGRLRGRARVLRCGRLAVDSGAPAERDRHRSRRQGAIVARRAARRHRVRAALTSARF